MKIKLTAAILLASAAIIPFTAVADQDAPAPAQRNTTSLFTPEQESRIGEVAADYLLRHPDILVKVSQELEARSRQQQMQKMATAAISRQKDLLQDKDAPSYGPDDAGVVMVEFFDYQCVYCSHLAPVVENIMKANPGVRFIFREWPIFARSWPVSMSAAQTGLRIWKQKGADAYLAYHNGIFATGHFEGKLTDNDISKVADSVKFKASVAANVQDELDKTSSLAQAIGLQGTPGLVIIPAKNATPENTTIIPGMATEATLQAAIDKASGK
ncbi:thioredoxin domain-containing protein [Salmonella enterica]|nr:thioredoxin domain-containing protein [Salmonella enterica]